MVCRFFLLWLSPIFRTQLIVSLWPCRELLKYRDDLVQLAETDLDRITKAKPLNEAKEMNSDVKNDSSQVDDEKEVNMLPNSAEAQGTDSSESHTALKLSFTLPASCYATMAIRELLKASTSVRTIFSDLTLHLVIKEEKKEKETRGISSLFAQ